MCKPLLKNNAEKLTSDFENIQPTMNNENYNCQKIVQENFNEESLDEQARCFVLGYN